MKRFRPNVAIVVLNHDGQLLACERSDLPGVWQVPQGGIEVGESEEDALMRELEEEIGTNDIEMIGKLPEKVIYEWPEELYRRGFHGQEQTYFLVRLNPDAQIHFAMDNPEFSSFAWVSAKEFLSRISGFKREPYAKAIDLIHYYFPGELQHES